jgi:hypothetical protein
MGSVAQLIMSNVVLEELSWEIIGNSFSFRVDVPLTYYRDLLLFLISGTCFVTCYRNPSLFHISGTCFAYLLPKSSVVPHFGHMFRLLVTEIISCSTFRAHVPLICYRNLKLFHISGTCSTYLLPKSFALPHFGHMFRLLVTEILRSSTFRAHVPLTCYQTLKLSLFSATCTPPKQSPSPSLDESKEFYQINQNRNRLHFFIFVL